MQDGLNTNSTEAIVGVFFCFFLLALKPHQSEVHENKLFVPKRRINSYHVFSGVNYDGQ